MEIIKFTKLSKIEELHEKIDSFMSNYNYFIKQEYGDDGGYYISTDKTYMILFDLCKISISKKNDKMKGVNHYVIMDECLSFVTFRNLFVKLFGKPQQSEVENE